MKYILYFLKNLFLFLAFFGLATFFGFLLASFIVYMTQSGNIIYLVISLFVLVGIIFATLNTVDFYRKNKEEQTTS